MEQNPDSKGEGFDPSPIVAAQLKDPKNGIMGEGSDIDELLTDKALAKTFYASKKLRMSGLAVLPSRKRIDLMIGSDNPHLKRHPKIMQWCSNPLCDNNNLAKMSPCLGTKMDPLWMKVRTHMMAGASQLAGQKSGLKRGYCQSIKSTGCC